MCWTVYVGGAAVTTWLLAALLTRSPDAPHALVLVDCAALVVNLIGLGLGFISWLMSHAQGFYDCAEPALIGCACVVLAAVGGALSWLTWPR